MLVFLWLIQIVYMDKFYSLERERQTKELSEKIVKDLALHFRAGDLGTAEFQAAVDRLALEYEACVVIADRSGTPLFSGIHILGDCVVHNFKGMELYRLYEATAAFGGVHSEFMDTKWRDNRDRNDMMIYSVLIKEGFESYCLIANTNIVPLASTANALRTELLWISFAMLFIALLLAIVISRDVSSPMAKMNVSAKQLATGNYSVKFTGRGYREILELAESLNYAASELSKVDRLKSELIANISHDLRTPLTMITGYAEMIRDLPGEKSTENVQVIIDEAHRLADLVNDLLDLSKLQAGASMLQLTSFSLNGLVDEILGRFNAVSEKSGISIQFSSEGDISIIADRAKLSQVIYNLLSNAINYTGEDKRIKVSARLLEGGHARLEVSDNGPGIPEEMMPYIWERYYRAENGHLRAEVGTGLGLSIVKTILEMHEAKFGVQAPSEGGSVFWFEI